MVHISTVGSYGENYHANNIYVCVCLETSTKVSMNHCRGGYQSVGKDIVTTKCKGLEHSTWHKTGNRYS